MKRPEKYGGNQDRLFLGLQDRIKVIIFNGTDKDSVIKLVAMEKDYSEMVKKILDSGQTP